MENETIILIISIAVFVLFVLITYLGVIYLPKLKKEKQGYPLEAEIEAVLLPYLYQAICVAFKASEKAYDDLGVKLDGVDKKKIAASIYKLLPTRIGKWDITFIKSIISEERFSQLIQNAYDNFKVFMVSRKELIEEEFEEWKKEYETSKSENIHPSL